MTRRGSSRDNTTSAADPRSRGTSEASLVRRLEDLEAAIERSEGRIVTAIYGAASLILAGIAYGLLTLSLS